MSIHEARRLFVDEGLSQEEAADRAGVSVSYVKKISARDGWLRARERLNGQQLAYQGNIRALKVAAAEKAVSLMERDNTGDPCTPYSDATLEAIKAWRTLEATFPEHRYGEGGDADQEARKRGRLEALEVICGWAAEHAPDLLAALEPHLVDLGQLIDRTADAA